MAQSTNDVFQTAIRIANVSQDLITVLKELRAEFEKRRKSLMGLSKWVGCIFRMYPTHSYGSEIFSLRPNVGERCVGSGTCPLRH